MFDLPPKKIMFEHIFDSSSTDEGQMKSILDRRGREGWGLVSTVLVNGSWKFFFVRELVQTGSQVVPRNSPR